MSDFIYSIEEAVEYSKIPHRTLQRYCKQHEVQKEYNRYLIPKKLLDSWIEKYRRTANKTTRNDVDTPNDANDVELIQEGFTPEEYDLFQSRLREYPQLQKEIKFLVDRIEDYKNEISYLKNSLDKRANEVDGLIKAFNNSLKTMQERNFIEAKEKKLDR